MSRFTLAASAATILFVAAPSMAATSLFNLSVVDPSAGLGSGVFGTVSVTESGGSLIFTETLNSGYKIHAGNANHTAFAFSLDGSPDVTFSDITSGFSRVSGSSISAPPFTSGSNSNFDYALSCDVCGSGYGGGFSGPLSFKVTANSGTLSLASLVFNTYDGQQVYFSSDLVSGLGSTSGSTGNVGAVLVSTTAVPEPASWAMFIGGFGLVGGALRRRRRVNVAFA